MSRAKDIAVLVILLAVLARVLWWSLTPMLPWVLVLLGLLAVYQVIFKRRW